jgi:5-methylcytosine-specific restriction protein A
MSLRESVVVTSVPLDFSCTSKHIGHACQVCRSDFETRYGQLGHEYVEAHHLTPFSELDERPRSLDPAKDFAVVCSNGHRMLHR